MILLTGANGVVGYALQQRLTSEHYLTVSRKAGQGDIAWDMNSQASDFQLPALKKLVHCAPIWLLPAHLPALYRAGISQFIVFSSTSIISKQDSANPEEQELVDRLSSAEKAIEEFCKQHDLSLTILRPSMIYGYGRDQNINHIASFIDKYGFAVVAGKANGLRQPVHAGDLAELCMNLISQPQQGQGTYTVAGQDVITYRAMVKSIFIKLNKRPIIISIPLWSLRLVLTIASRLGRFKYTADMADRMQQDLVYNNQAAIEGLAYKPSPFLEKPQRDLANYVV